SDLMIHISPKQLDCRVNERLASLLSAHAVHLEALARLLRRPFRASGGLSARFDFRFGPSQPEEKSRRQPPHRSGRQFPAPPPRRPSRFLFVDYRAQRPQQPEHGGHQFHPGRLASFRRQPIELSAHQTEFLLPKSDTVLNAKALIVNGLGLAPRRRSGRALFTGPWLARDEQQPEWALISRLAIGAVLDHLIERQWLRRPTFLPHVLPATGFDPSTCGEAPTLRPISGRMRLRIVELEFRAELRRT